MSTQEHLKVLRERWFSIVAVILVAVALGIAFLLLRPPAYTAALQMYVSSPAAGTSDAASLSGAQLAQDRVKSYQELVTSPRVLSDAVASARLPMTVSQLRERVSVTVTDESVIMVISVEDPSPVVAAQAANAVGDALTNTVNSLERPAATGSLVAQPVMTVRAVEPAPVPEDQSATSSKRILGIAFLLGLAGGVGLALSRNAADNSLRTPEQLATTIDVPNLGNVSLVSSVSKRPLLVIDDPNSAAAEDFRRLRTNLQFIEADKDHKVLMVCSALPQEGKTTTAINLALALSVAGHRVLLIDADLRRPAIAERCGLEQSPGLTNVLAGSISLFQAIQTISSVKLDVLASGTVPPNPSELLASSQNARLLDQARTRYDVVLIDTPPLLPVSDAASLAPITDASLVVCRANRTSSVEVRRCAHALRSVSNRIGGTVLVGGERTGKRLSPYSYSRVYRPDQTDQALMPETVVADGTREAAEFDSMSSAPAPSRRPRPYPSAGALPPPSHPRDDFGTEQIAARWNGHR